jgi:hypothetical protein
MPKHFQQINMRKAILIFSFLLCNTACSAVEGVNVLPQYQYTANTDLNEKIDATLVQARMQKKLAMIVLGSTWCHDSVGLSQNFSNEAMHKILREHYSTLFIDVGYLEDLRHVTQRFGYPGYFGTPTVLVIEPNTLTLLNHDDVNVWQSANSVPFEEYVSYFTLLSNAEPMALIEQNSQIANAQIRAFEQTQIERLFRAYAILGPLLKADDEGALENAEDFYANWRKVYEFRTQLQADLVSLKKQARLGLMNGNGDESYSLEIPTYPAFDWE